MSAAIRRWKTIIINEQETVSFASRGGVLFLVNCFVVKLISWEEALNSIKALHWTQITLCSICAREAWSFDA